YHILYYYSGEPEIPIQVIQIVKTIIGDFFNKKNTDKGKVRRYLNLMKIPFHSVSLWEESSLENIRRWENRPRNLVTNTVLAHRSKPTVIKYMCKAILKNW